MLAYELVDLVLHADVVADRDVAVAEENLDSTLFHAVVQICGLIYVKKDRIAT